MPSAVVAEGPPAGFHAAGIEANVYRGGRLGRMGTVRES